ncbi:hypothetical protein K3495_g16394 [Podosphaera aphanis]|nr:hypothetical protein K3495_g16394 [Podosphaera aphanis]
MEADRKKEEEKLEQNVQVADQDAFYSSHMALDGPEYIHFTSYSLSSDSWIADSGASAHIANRREMFVTFAPCKRKLNVAGGLTTEIEGIGTIHMRSLVEGKIKNFKLIDVLYVPKTQFCLISGPKIDKAGGKIIFGNNRCRFSNTEGDTIANGILDGNLYRVDAKAIIAHYPVTNIAINSTISWEDAHRRLGHISLSSMKILFRKNTVNGIELDKKEAPQSLNYTQKNLGI